MAIDPSATSLRDTARPQTAPLPGGEQIIATPDAVKHLQIPDEVALRPENVIPFLAGQHAKLVDITARPEIKALEGDIPEFLFNDRTPMVTAMSREEQSSLGEWREQAFLKIQSGSPGMEEIGNEINSYISEALKKDPTLFQQSSSGSTSDILEQYMTGQMIQETEETKKKYHEALAMARSPQDVILIMTAKHAQDATAKIGQMVQVYSEQMDSMDKMQAQFDLDQASGHQSQADLAKANMQFSSMQGDVMNLFQVIQMEMNNLEKTQDFGNSSAKSVNEIAKDIQNNLR